MATRLLTLLTLLPLSCVTPAGPPIEATVAKLLEHAVLPAVADALATQDSSLLLQGGAQGINPAYVVRFSGRWCTGIEGEVRVGVDGLAGQIQITAQPAPATQPQEPQP